MALLFNPFDWDVKDYLKLPFQVRLPFKMLIN